jgi:hypothetical protein
MGAVKLEEHECREEHGVQCSWKNLSAVKWKSMECSETGSIERSELEEHSKTG